MKFYKVTAIVRSSDLEAVESALQKAAVRGISVSRVTGLGEYCNYFTSDWMTGHTKIEVFTRRAREIADVIIEAAHSGRPGDGLVAILPVESIIRIRDHKVLEEAEE